MARWTGEPLATKIRAIITISFVSASLAVAASVGLGVVSDFVIDPSELARRPSVKHEEAMRWIALDDRQLPGTRRRGWSGAVAFYGVSDLQHYQEIVWGKPRCTHSRAISALCRSAFQRLTEASDIVRRSAAVARAS
jgi:hypothetical protein